MKKSTILVHFLNGLKPPHLYQARSWAKKRCEKDPGYEIIECNDENQALELFNLKMEVHKTATIKNRIAILKNNIEKMHSEGSH